MKDAVGLDNVEIIVELDTELHQRASDAAQVQGTTLEQFVSDAIDELLARGVTA